MNTTGLPKKQPVPFGANGQREDLLPTTPAGDNTASYDAGFPPVTMILKAAGGLPPKGQDMNQILFELSAIARWMNAGASYPFDATFASAVGGYPKGAVLPNSTSTGYWMNQTENNSSTPETSATVNTGWVPVDQYGVTAITGLAAASVTLTTLQAAKSRITLAGTLTANINLIFPAWVNTWVVINNCTGTFSVTCKTPSGTGVTIPNGLTAVINGDGTNINQDSNLLGLPGRLLNTQTFTASGTYTPTPGTNTLKVRAIGGGGSSGGVPATPAGQTGLSQAGYYGQFIELIIPVTAFTGQQTVIVGAGGVPPSAGGNTGNAGGVTSFGSIFFLPGGPGGAAGFISASNGSAGASLSTQAITSTITPINSSGGISRSSTVLQATPGSFIGQMPLPSPIEGGFYGSGGIGAVIGASSAALPGVAGNRGVMIIQEFS
ncbi:hypothetical protein [Rahnella inusitata]|uniref:hypothetical protein n=1 Tax=Rahnella inusitata TaxID=58169 RepID=UPI0039B04DD5